MCECGIAPRNRAASAAVPMLQACSFSIPHDDVVRLELVCDLRNRRAGSDRSTSPDPPCARTKKPAPHSRRSSRRAESPAPPAAADRPARTSPRKYPAGIADPPRRRPAARTSAWAKRGRVRESPCAFNTSMARFTSSSVRSMMFLPHTTRSSQAVMPMAAMAAAAALRSGENSSVMAASSSLGFMSATCLS